MRRCHTHTCLGSAPSPAQGSLCAGGRCCSLWCSAPWWPGQAQQRAGWLLPALAFRQRVPGAPAPGCKKPCYNRHKLATRASHVITYKSTPCQCSARLNRTAHLTAYVRSSPPLERRLAPGETSRARQVPVLLSLAVSTRAGTASGLASACALGWRTEAGPAQVSALVLVCIIIHKVTYFFACCNKLSCAASCYVTLRNAVPAQTLLSASGKQAERSQGELSLQQPKSRITSACQR